MCHGVYVREACMCGIGMPMSRCQYARTQLYTPCNGSQPHNLTRVACRQHAKDDLVLSLSSLLSWELQSKRYSSLTLWQADGQGHWRYLSIRFHWRDLILKMVLSIATLVGK